MNTIILKQTLAQNRDNKSCKTSETSLEFEKSFNTVLPSFQVRESGNSKEIIPFWLCKRVALVGMFFSFSNELLCISTQVSP